LDICATNPYVEQKEAKIKENTMKTMPLKNKQSMPQIGLGTWQSKPGEVGKIVEDALTYGYRHIDCAAIYKNEEEIGESFKRVFQKTDLQREDVFITSKLWNNAHREEDVLPALKKTLHDLKLDYLDLYLIHWPVVFKKGVTFPESPDEFLTLDEVPIMETYQAMEQALKQGLVKALGVSNFNQQKLGDLLKQANTPPCVNQVECHPYLQQRELLSFCQENEVVLTCYSPIGSPGRSEDSKAKDEPLLLEDKVIVSLAEKYQKTPAQIILQWSMQRGTVVIPKTTHLERAIENFEAQQFEMEPADCEKITSLDQSYRFVKGSFFTSNESPYSQKDLWG
jgi:alcohol dehydrogenase (NADP+)